MSKTNYRINKPKTVTAVFILNVIMMILPFVFYTVFTTQNITIDGLDPMLMIYTGIAYIVSFVPLVISIRTKRIWLFRSILLLNILIALPAKAYIGIIVAIVSIIISLTKRVTTYFQE